MKTTTVHNFYKQITAPDTEIHKSRSNNKNPFRKLIEILFYKFIISKNKSLFFKFWNFDDRNAKNKIILRQWTEHQTPNATDMIQNGEFIEMKQSRISIFRW